MTQHSTEELRRQRDAAKSRHVQAGMDLALAEKRLHDALCRESGLIGAVATDTQKGTKVLIHDVEFMSCRPWAVRGFAYKADGSVGFSERRVYLDRAAIQGGRS